ncbi:DUF1622 domain-containing protein [Yoonia vestfoldensis]|uniref:DUF1622 domain-containing protein n=1 Tax=Yoonia vestfoldensis TaxID=245188 RepID=UPI00035E0085|nr:DUF1622 domain-containing protein [Yoonia vestfoldensis]
MGTAFSHSILDTIARILEGAGVVAILVGAVLAVYAGARGVLRRDDGQKVFELFRTRLAKSILIGVEFLIAADIIGTVIVAPSMDSLAVLALIVLIRTFLSFSLEVEIEGRWPWQRHIDRRPDK